MPDIMHHEPTLDHAAQAAAHVLALVAAGDPSYRVTPERHDSMVALLESIVRMLALEVAR